MPKYYYHTKFFISYTLLCMSRICGYTLMIISLYYIITDNVVGSIKPTLFTFIAFVLKDVFNKICHDLADECEDGVEVHEISRKELEEIMDDDFIDKLENLDKKLTEKMKDKDSDNKINKE